jgi:hypothetical protein
VEAVAEAVVEEAPTAVAAVARAQAARVAEEEPVVVAVAERNSRRPPVPATRF